MLNKMLLFTTLEQHKLEGQITKNMQLVFELHRTSLFLTGWLRNSCKPYSKNKIAKRFCRWEFIDKKIQVFSVNSLYKARSARMIKHGYFFRSAVS